MASPTSRTLALLKKEGWTAQIVEKWNAYSQTRLDLFGIIDVLAVRPPDEQAVGRGKILGVQTTSASHVSARMQKAMAEPRLVVWLQAGGLFEVHGWGKKGKKGARKLYQVSKRRLVLVRGKVVEVI